METNELIGKVTGILKIAMPVLAKGGGMVADVVAGRLGKEGLELAKGLWELLQRSIESRPAAKEAADDLAAGRGDADTEAQLRVQLKKILAEHPELATAIGELLARQPPGQGAAAQLQGSGAIAQGERAVAAGEGGIAVGGDLHGGIKIGR